MNPLFEEIAGLPTERRNPDTRQIDELPTLAILQMLNREDAKVVPAVAAVLDNIALAVDHIVAALRRGGRLLYVGAGTSGRLGILDASECPPTFGTPPELVQGIIAGGPAAVFQSQEGAEDSPAAGAEALRALAVRECDVVCGLAASGRTPFVLGALHEAAGQGATTLFVTTSSPEKLAAAGIRADVLICPDVGPEAIAGSTRMKSGTAQKLVLNMLTTAAMIRMGKTFGNVMVDLQQSNAKLRVRSQRIVMEVTGADYESAELALSEAGGHVKTALVMLLADVDAKEARQLLQAADGHVRRALTAADSGGKELRDE